VGHIDGGRTQTVNRPSQQAPIEELHILWITAGLGCDGDTIAATGATQPSLEDILTGGVPGTPRVPGTDAPCLRRLSRAPSRVRP